MRNIPEVKLGLVAVSRDCFPIDLSRRRRDAVAAACAQAGKPLFVTDVIIEKETDVPKALAELTAGGCNALVVFLGNFGPEEPAALLAQSFDGPRMFVAVAEETGDDLIDGRGDAYCGLLNAGYNLNLRGVRAYIPEYPVGGAKEVAAMIADFIPVARILIGLKSLKIITFGPRPTDFLACNAPISPLYGLGISVQENSELDLLTAYQKHADDKRIPGVAADMAAQIGTTESDLLTRLAQYELTLLDWLAESRGASQFTVLANKCWPAFQGQFGFTPCYVNARLTGQMIPVACETDIYGGLSEYMLACATGLPPTLLDINNTVPPDMFATHIQGRTDYAPTDVFMGFHCGNTPINYLKKPKLSYQLIMKRNLEPDGPPDITRGTLEGDLNAGNITLFRLQGGADNRLCAYTAQGEILDVETRSFGGIGIFAVREMGRFYRHVLLGKHFPHHAGVGFAHAGKALFAALKILGVCDVSYNRPISLPYPDENPF